MSEVSLSKRLGGFGRGRPVGRFSANSTTGPSVGVSTLNGSSNPVQDGDAANSRFPALNSLNNALPCYQCCSPDHQASNCPMERSKNTVQHTSPGNSATVNDRLRDVSGYTELYVHPPKTYTQIAPTRAFGNGGVAFGSGGVSFNSANNSESSSLACNTTSRTRATDFQSGGASNNRTFPMGGAFGSGYTDNNTNTSARNGCSRCGSMDHFVRDCPRPQACFNCGSNEHQRVNCPLPSHPARAPLPRGGACYNCGGPHVAAACPSGGAKDFRSRIREQRGGPKPYIPEEVPVDDLFKPENLVHVGSNFGRFDELSDSKIQNTSGTEPIMTFDDANLHPKVMENVRKDERIQYPTAIQKHVIPIIMNGTKDVMACAFTGSGKTVAYVLPTVSTLLESDLDQTHGPQHPLVLVLAPSRELSNQIYDDFRKFACDVAYFGTSEIFLGILRILGRKKTNLLHGLGTKIKIVNVYGGVSLAYERSVLQQGCHVLIGPAGRLLHHIEQQLVFLDRVLFFILDEADRMLEQHGFLNNVYDLVRLMPQGDKRQTLMFSATMHDEAQKMAKDFLREKYCFVGTPVAANEDIEQIVLEVSNEQKTDKLKQILEEELRDYNNAKQGDKWVKKIMIFARMKRTVDYLAAKFSQMEYPSTSYHGDRAQQERHIALNDFKFGQCPVLICTDAGARGLDIMGINHVINYDLPDEIVTYIHRIGRTARIGNRGKSTSFFDYNKDSDLVHSLVNVLANAKQEVPHWLLAYKTGAAFGTAFGAANNQSSEPWNTGAVQEKTDDTWD